MTQKSLPTRLQRTSVRALPEGLDQEAVRRVVETFYRRARGDDVIGPIFNRVIAEDDWPEHLDKIERFWSSMLLGTGTYAGRPMQKHLAIHLDDAHFARWLALFKETVDALCSPAVSALFVDRAERVAQSFRLGLAQHRGQDSLGIAPTRAGED